MIIRTTPKFEKKYKKLPDNIKNKAKERELIFRENPFNPKLRTHKLSGKDQNSWSFYVDYSIRIKFIFLSNKEVLFLDIGLHNIYK